MQNIYPKQNFSCLTDYALETINSIDLPQITYFFDNLICDQYLQDNYRFRRLSRFKVINNKIVQLPHNYLFQSSDYNPILGDVIREYPEIEDGLIQQPDFEKIILEFYEFCRLCSRFNEIAVHQIRTITSKSNVGEPAPEGVHQDGVDLVGIFCVNRENITGGITKLSQSKNGSPVLEKILNPGEFLVFTDSQFWHYTSAITAISAERGVRDVFVLTCPGLLPPSPKDSGIRELGN